MEKFTFEEINLICCFKGETRADTVADMTAAIPYMERDMLELVERTTQKLNELTEKEYSELTFEPAEDIKN